MKVCHLCGKGSVTVAEVLGEGGGIMGRQSQGRAN